MKWNCAGRTREGCTRGKTARVPFFRPVSLTPGIFSGIYQSADRRRTIPSCDIRVACSRIDQRDDYPAPRGNIRHAKLFSLLLLLLLDEQILDSTKILEFGSSSASLNDAFLWKTHSVSNVIIPNVLKASLERVHLKK